MSYSIKEVFYSLQGEGFHSGRPAIFCRFSKCNLWTGREEDRADAVCQFCDTDFIGTDGQNGGKFADAEALAQHLLQFWPDKKITPFVVLTGGEPLLQVDRELIEVFHRHGIEIAVETNGTKQAPDGIDWVCVSPKANAPLLLDHGHELKLVYPQADCMPEKVAELAFDHFYLQPMDDADPQVSEANIKAAVQYCLEHPQWKLSLQTHKLLGID
ncbi:7-carboxy-7-deazaguanine synthase [Thiomicrorhabdus xiamenensis]|uniref:7-carboxy-7-deazaguanine synthase n=1 Tax=Thiomicrorhabdus xiamenensis TaxID=2739063 RepID=A0A7D4TFG3_9GAMM|nr:7-carboxy-7-deazaguanine synthase [Thiomicrorhabdus xiamenensis]QKI88848.1 7-carboxy-7-deazaguanine synthase [Thiomicrorhabdus xiamenensis]